MKHTRYSTCQYLHDVSIMYVNMNKCGSHSNEETMERIGKLYKKRLKDKSNLVYVELL